MNPLSCSLLLLLLVACEPASPPTQLAELERANAAQAEHSRALIADANALGGRVRAFAASARQVANEYRRAELEFRRASTTADAAASDLKKARADYEAAAEAYRMNALLLSIAAGKVKLEDAACAPIQAKLSTLLKDADIAVESVSDDAVNGILGTAGLEDNTHVRALAETYVRREVMEKAKRAPMEAIDQISSAALAALGCGRSET